MAFININGNFYTLLAFSSPFAEQGGQMESRHRISASKSKMMNVKFMVIVRH
jgi:hypothetical protein